MRQFGRRNVGAVPNETGVATGGPWGAIEPAPAVFGNQRQKGVADDIDFEIKGAELQFVEIELDPDESCVAEAGALMFKHALVEMRTIFGDGSGADRDGVLSKLTRGLKRAVSGSTLFLTKFTHSGFQGKARVAFAAPSPGKIVPLRLDEFNGQILCQRDAFLAGARGVEIDIAFQQRIMAGMFGGEGFVLQRLSGDGWVFIHAGGTVEQYELAPGEVLHVDAGCFVAQTASVSFDIAPVGGGVKSWLFGGEGLFMARLTGPGHVWIQSLPLSRLAATIAARMPSVAPSLSGSLLGSD